MTDYINVRVFINSLDHNKYYYIYNFAANIGDFKYLENYDDFEDDIVSTECLEMLHCLLYSKLFFPSSSQVYNKEQLNSSIKEEPNPVTFYGISKHAIEENLMIYARSNNREKDVKIARIYNIYGEYDTLEPLRVIPALCKKVIRGDKKIKILGNGKQKRGFMYVWDFCVAVDSFIHSDRNEIVKIGSSSIYTVDEVVDLLFKISGKNLKKIYEFDNDVVDNIIYDGPKWEERFSFPVGLSITYKHIKESWYENIH